MNHDTPDSADQFTEIMFSNWSADDMSHMHLTIMEEE